MADEAKVEQVAAAVVAQKPEAKPAAKAEAKPKKVKFETTGDFQLYDVNSRTLFPADGSAEAYEDNPFVVTHLKRGNLKKA